MSGSARKDRNQEHLGLPFYIEAVEGGEYESFDKKRSYYCCVAFCWE